MEKELFLFQKKKQTQTKMKKMLPPFSWFSLMTFSINLPALLLFPVLYVGINFLAPVRIDGFSYDPPVLTTLVGAHVSTKPVLRSGAVQSFELVDGVLPAGLSLDSHTGILSGMCCTTQEFLLINDHGFSSFVR